MTKTQKRNSLKSILNKSKKLWLDAKDGDQMVLNTQDFVAIEKVVMKALRRLK